MATKASRLRNYREQFDKGESYVFGLFNNDGGAFTGSVGLHTKQSETTREIGYWIHVQYINQGYATEAAGALTKVAFDNEQIDRLKIHCDPNNNRSQNIPGKLGYQLNVILKNSKLDTLGNFRDEMIWSMARKEYGTSSIKHMKLKTFDIFGKEFAI